MFDLKFLSESLAIFLIFMAENTLFTSYVWVSFARNLIKLEIKKHAV